MSTYQIEYQNKLSTKRNATLFAIFLLVLLATSLIAAFATAGPIVLGTEMNTNGLVEYMCLGRGCEDLTSFKWAD